MVIQKIDKRQCTKMDNAKAHKKWNVLVGLRQSTLFLAQASKKIVNEVLKLSRK